MGLGQDIAGEIASGLGRARQLLRDQLETLVGLAAIAVRMIESVAQAVADPAWPLAGRLATNPMAGVVAVEKTLHGYARVSWALRLIRALRAKLLDDLRRVDRGEVVDVPPPTQPAKAQATKNRPATSMAAELAKLIAAVDADRGDGDPLESERPETESFGRYVSNRSGDAEFAAILKRPTEEVIALIREALGVNEEPEQEPFPPGGGRAGMRGLGPVRHRSRKTLLRGEPPEPSPESLHPHPRPFPLPQGEGGPQR